MQLRWLKLGFLGSDWIESGCRGRARRANQASFRKPHCRGSCLTVLLLSLQFPRLPPPSSGARPLVQPALGLRPFPAGSSSQGSVTVKEAYKIPGKQVQLWPERCPYPSKKSCRGKQGCWKRKAIPDFHRSASPLWDREEGMTYCSFH